MAKLIFEDGNERHEVQMRENEDIDADVFMRMVWALMMLLGYTELTINKYKRTEE